jgi:hypothetical protein
MHRIGMMQRGYGLHDDDRCDANEGPTVPGPSKPLSQLSYWPHRSSHKSGSSTMSIEPRYLFAARVRNRRGETTAWLVGNRGGTQLFRLRVRA